jgi:SAM-dependent methyltransferase
MPKNPSYYAGCNRALLEAIATSARRVLDVGCGEGMLGAALKERQAGCTVFGIEREPEVAARAANRLDQVFTLDVEHEAPPMEPGSLDCVLFGDVLEHLVDPEAVLRRYRPLLAPEGLILCSVPNLQHHSMLAALLTGDFQYADAGLLDRTHLRFFTLSTMFKLLLDAGFAPDVVDIVLGPCPRGLIEAAGPLLDYLGLHRGRMAHHLSAYQYILRGRPLGWDGKERTREAPRPGHRPPGRIEPDEEVPISIVACVTDRAILEANLLASPDLGRGSIHETIFLSNCLDAAAGLTSGLARARNDLVVWAHQDVYLPRGWPARLVRQMRLAEHQWGRLGVGGVYGVAQDGQRPVRVGRVVDRDRLLDEGVPVPARVGSLDELLLVMHKDSQLRPSSGLGFHLYGTDLCLAAQAHGLPAVVLDALCFHNSRHVELPRAFAASAARLAARWPARMPVATPCALIGRNGELQTF